jgi:transcription elongation factor GreA
MKTLESRNNRVAMWSTVAVRDLATHEVDVYTLVPHEHADISLNRVSSFTPVAHALYDRHAGETVEVDAPAGVIRLEVLSVRHGSSVQNS